MPTTFADIASRVLPGGDVFILDPDLRLALEDMCAAAEGPQWRQHWTTWISQVVNDGLRAYLGR